MVADGKGLIGHAGAVLLRWLADRTGLTVALAAVLPAGTGTGWRERAAVVVQLAVAIVLGAVNLSDAEQLQAHHQGLFGAAVSRLDDPPDATPSRSPSTAGSPPPAAEPQQPQKHHSFYRPQ
ncbi:hypothetical protein [Streptomyces sp. 900105245]